VKRVALVAAVCAGALLLPGAASAHAYLVKTQPAASVTLNGPPGTVELTFDEAVEPRFALISVTDTAARQEVTGPVTRSPANPDTLIVPLKKVGEGWYLVYWRAISVDGHPVQGVFTFAVGPNTGPPPEFTPPHVSATATSTPLLIARWLALLTTMIAIGLFVLRIVVAQPLIRRVSGTSLRALTVAFGVASATALVAVPAYVEESTAVDSLRSFWAFGALVPLWRTTAFGRGYVDLEICFALFAAAAAIALWLDRPAKERRTIAALLALCGALLAAAATLALPGVSGHAAQTTPRGWALLLDWLHLITGSLWLGGLVGLLVLWRGLPLARRVAGLVVVVPRFSNMALVSVLLLLASGVGASVLHLPVLNALWLTSYGKTILVKAAILALAMLLAAGNLLWTKPRLAAGKNATRVLRRLVTVEAVLVAGAVLAAAVLSSLAPPPPAFAEEGKALARVGPGNVAASVKEAGYELRVLVAPNKAVAPNSFALELTRSGRPVTGANVTLSFAMLDMQMPNQQFDLTETQPGVYQRKTPALVMVGHWALSFNITPTSGAPFSATVVDHATG
jgi:copper transport protein